MPSTFDSYLEHYGVLGMKWGVRKDRSKSTNRLSRRKEKYKKIIEDHKKKEKLGAESARKAGYEVYKVNGKRKGLKIVSKKEIIQKGQEWAKKNIKLQSLYDVAPEAARYYEEADELLRKLGKNELVRNLRYMKYS